MLSAQHLRIWSVSVWDETGWLLHRDSTEQGLIVRIGDCLCLSAEYRGILRFADANLDGSKRVPYGLVKILGIGTNYARAAVKVANISETALLGNLSDTELQRLEEVLRNPMKFGIPEWIVNRRRDMETGQSGHIIGPELVLRTKTDVEFMKNIRSWKGIRHSLGLKVRGQRTKTSGRTGRSVGVRKKAVVAAGRQPATKE